MIREKFKDIELNDKRWRIGSFTALTGNTIAVKLISRLSNVMFGAAAGVLSNPVMLQMSVMTELGNFSSNELLEIQTTALSVCGQLRKTGDVEAAHPVRLPDGRWDPDADLENDGPMVLALTCHALAFNLLPFFEGGVWKSLKDSFQAYTLPTFFANVQTSMNTVSPQ